MAKITEYLEIILEGADLTFAQAEKLLDTVFEGEVADVQIAAFLAAMRAKTATSNELAGLAKSLRDHSVRVETGIDNLVDTCGTGGAKLKTFNISTASAIVAAGAGVFVAKHGNRGITSKCGSADVLAALGVNVEASPETIARSIQQAHIGFMFAPMFHPAMKYVQPIRKSLDFRTAFNILGPLANPARATAQVMGVPQEDLMERIAQAISMLDIKRAMVVHSDGLDEISTMGPTKILHLKDGNITPEVLNPADYGIELANFDQLAGGDAETNAEIVRQVIAGKDTGPRKDIVILNAAAAIIVSDLADNFKDAIDIANTAITDGNAQQALDKFIEVSNS